MNSSTRISPKVAGLRFVISMVASPEDVHHRYIIGTVSVMAGPVPAIHV
jgi:hypothetical protein